jgi:hypothetical protein
LPGHPAIVRVRACDLAPDSDLGERLVTQSVGALAAGEVREALDSGARAAESLQEHGLIRAAALRLKDETRITATAGLRAITTEDTKGHGENRALAGEWKGSIVHA